MKWIHKWHSFDECAPKDNDTFLIRDGGNVYFGRLTQGRMTTCQVFCNINAPITLEPKGKLLADWLAFERKMHHDPKWLELVSRDEGVEQ